MGTDKPKNNWPCVNCTEFTDGCPTDHFPSHLFPLSHPSLHTLVPNSICSNYYTATFVADNFFGLIGKEQRDHRGYKNRQWNVYYTVTITQNETYFFAPRINPTYETSWELRGLYKYILIIFCVKVSQDETFLDLQKLYTSLVSSTSYYDSRIQPYWFNRSTKLQEIVTETLTYDCFVLLLPHYYYFQILIV
jgi:hypothetical protein